MIELHLGDCLEMMLLLNQESVDCIFTDPPYGKGYHDGGPPNIAGTKWQGKTVRGDKKPDTRCIPLMANILKPGGTLYLYSQWMVEREWIEAIQKAGLRVRNRIVWPKSHWGMGDPKTTYGPQHETILFASKGRHELIGKRCGDVWHDDQRGTFRTGRIHPNQKPVEHAVKAIRMSTNPGDLILDPYLGSGSTGIAAIREGRNFIGMEIDKGYFELAQNRIAAEGLDKTATTAQYSNNGSI